MCCKYSVCKSQHKEVQILTDASKDAIAAVAFLKVCKDKENSDICFLMGKAKVALTHGHIPNTWPHNSKAGIVCSSSWDRDSRNYQRTDGYREEEFQVLQ